MGSYTYYFIAAFMILYAVISMLYLGYFIVCFLIQNRPEKKYAKAKVIHTRRALFRPNRYINTVTFEEDGYVYQLKALRSVPYKVAVGEYVTIMYGSPFKRHLPAGPEDTVKRYGYPKLLIMCAVIMLGFVASIFLIYWLSGLQA